jgi:hypothetical protein
VSTSRESIVGAFNPESHKRFRMGSIAILLFVLAVFASKIEGMLGSQPINSAGVCALSTPQISSISMELASHRDTGDRDPRAQTW